MSRNVVKLAKTRKPSWWEIVGSQYYGPVGLNLLFEELTRCSLLNYFAQPHKLIYALIWLHVTPTFEIVHRRGTDWAWNYLALIDHCELNGHPIEIVALHLTSLQRHRKSPIVSSQPADGSVVAPMKEMANPLPIKRQTFRWNQGSSWVGDWTWMSAFGGKAVTSRQAAMSANDPMRTSALDKFSQQSQRAAAGASAVYQT
jgi:hypothetical protein